VSRRLRTRLRANSALATPSLNLEFATAAGGLDSRITFVRASTATFTGSNGLLQTAAIDTPRFDYDPVTLAPKGLLIEEQRTNLLLQSQTFGTSPWFTNNATITANTTVAPDGTTTASKLVEDTTNNLHRVAQVPTLTAVPHTATIYAKPAGRNWIYIANASLSQAAYFNVSTGVIGTVVGATTATIAPVGNGWYRCSITSTPSAAAQNYSFYAANADLSFSYTGDGTSGLFIWGAQLEAGAFATSYIPTVASQVTRTPDQTTMTSTNFSSWYNQSEGTFVTSVDCPASGVRTEMSVDDGSVNNMFRMRSQVTDPFFIARVGGANVVILDGGTITANTPYTQANAYAVNNYGVSVNGGTAVTSASGAVPTVNQMTIGWESVGNYLNGHVRRIAYYSTRLADTTIQALSA